jgi:photosystem II stability/assembly factor-like uncharacterized protein
MSSTLYLGTRKGLIEVQRTNGKWTIARTSFLAVPIPMLLNDRRTNTLIAALDHGHFGTKMQQSKDGGATWEETACPTYPVKPDDYPEVVNPMSQQPIPWKLMKVWALEAAGADQPGLLWCGTIPGGLFKSTDNGKTWELVRSLWDHPGRAKWFGGGAEWPGIHSICVDPRDSRHVLLAVSCGGVWETRDAGDTWANIGEGLVADFMPPDQQGDPGIQDAHRIAMCPGNPDVIWLQHHNGIFLSRDCGQHWQRITNANPSDFGFAVVVHPQDANTAWFVPGIKDELRVPVDAALCVMRTRDGAASFEALRNGLPQEHAYHLVYRHSLDIAGDGRTLAFGSTTGSVWISEDSGESWERLSAELPPVYCVRFA